MRKWLYRLVGVAIAVGLVGLNISLDRQRCERVFHDAPKCQQLHHFP